jgi:hypothetical protein
MITFVTRHPGALDRTGAGCGDTIGAIRSKSRDTVATTIQHLARNVRLIFDDLRMTGDSRYRPLSGHRRVRTQ